MPRRKYGGIEEELNQQFLDFGYTMWLTKQALIELLYEQNGATKQIHIHNIAAERTDDWVFDIVGAGHGEVEYITPKFENLPKSAYFQNAAGGPKYFFELPDYRTFNGWNDPNVPQRVAFKHALKDIGAEYYKKGYSMDAEYLYPTKF